MRTWSHAWCKEGFATYCEALYFESLYGPDYYHAYMDEMNVLGYAILQLYNIQPPLHAAIYYKGAWVLHMLRHVIGDPAFFAGVRAYAEAPAFRYGVADTEDLRRTFEAAAGTDLAWFFAEWIYAPGYPVYQVEWSAEAAGGGYDVELAITQVQTVGPVFVMPLDVRIDTELGPRDFVVWDSLATQSFGFHVDAAPLGLEIDPDAWVIRSIEYLSGIAEGRPAAGRVDVRPNPFGGTAWIAFDPGRPGRVELDILDAGGRRVTRLVDASAGAAMRAPWNGTDAQGRPLASGVYYYRLRTDGAPRTGPVILVR
jgi:hypothetical protein